ncbi:MAG: zinc ribbon domain-containing protein [archaeon]|nr:zinc ribbon domain-containing protein [archaeon]
MVIRRCPQCKTATDDIYGFCIKCGYEFSNSVAELNKVCMKCGFENPNEATHCVKCGTPLEMTNIEDLLKNYNVLIKPSKTKSNASDVVITPTTLVKRTSKILIVLGYVFSLFSGLIGLIIAIYLATRKDPVAKKHGIIQLCIVVAWLAILTILIVSGYLDSNNIMGNYTQIANSMNMSAFNL